MQSAIVRRTYPWREKADGFTVTYRLMVREDRGQILGLGKGIEDRDRAFLRFDISDPEHVDRWIENLEKGRTISVLAEVDDTVVGYGNLHHNELTWSSHLGELRIFVGTEFRGTGIGKRLVGELIHIAKEIRLDRVICQLALPQTRVREMFERLGFRSEAILPDWLRSSDGAKHDLVIMSRSLIELDG